MVIKKSSGTSKSLLFAAVCFIICCGIWIPIDNWQTNITIHNKQDIVQKELAYSGYMLGNTVNTQFSLLWGIHAFVQSYLTIGDSISTESFETFASQIITQATGVRNMIIAPNGINTYVYPLQQNEQAVGHNLLLDERLTVAEDIQKTIESRKLILSGPYELRQGGFGVVGRLAVYNQDEFWGFVSMVLDMNPLYEKAGLPLETMRISLTGEESTFYGDIAIHGPNCITIPIKVQNEIWLLTGMPYGGWTEGMFSSMFLIRIMALLCITILSFMVYLISHRQHALSALVADRTQKLQKETESHRLAKENAENLNVQLSEKSEYISILINTPSNLIIFSLDKNYCYTSFNNNHALNMRQKFSVDIALEMNMLDNVHNLEHREWLKTTFDRMLRGDSWVEEIKDPNQSKYYEFTFTPIRNNEGIIGISVFAQDITSRKEFETTLASEKNRLSVTLQSIGDGVIATDTNGRIENMNNVAEELTGTTLTLAVGKPLATTLKVVTEHSRAPLHIPLEKILNTSEKTGFEQNAILVSRNRSEHHIELVCSQILDDEGVFYGVVIVFRNITEKLKLQNIMLRNVKLESLGIMAGGLAHDFNNLLSGIFGYMELAKDRCSDQKVKDYLEQALSAYDRAKDITYQLLTFSRGGAPVRKAVDLRNIVKKSAAFVMSGSRCTIAYNLPDNLWFCDADENQLGQVVDNLLINSQQAMPEGGSITIGLMNVIIENSSNHPGIEPGNYVEMKISDTGTGIRKDVFEKIFDPFFSTKNTGNGLGLATCYSIINKHGGIIEADSTEGKGTTFTIYLPGSEKASEKVITKELVQHTGTGLILVMDDEQSVLDLTRLMLEKYGYSVTTAHNGEQAIEICRNIYKSGKSLAGALLDLTIPGGMGGKKTAAILHHKFPDLAIFASSGYSNDPIIANPTDYGFTDSIQKPYSLQDLSALLNKYFTS
ncbi:MAG: PAS domain-containing protein [Bacteroidetes bacterium]|nr:PAS domain-containing protein [Bacteroidota bacterium]